MIIGIDLGTTFSVIAVDGRVELTKDHPPAIYLKELDVTIVPDPYGNDLIASAVWEDPDQPGKLIVGAEAKQVAAEGQTPILFSKRNMGTDIGHPLGDRTFSAREVAAEILKYLKGIAEQALGRTIDRAVITHPAFFDPAMKSETAAAARDAGFDFDEDLHLLMEPVAAALAYTVTDTRDPLQLLTYDLGGGTFDATVMQRQGGVITVKAFGGNRLLGGYNFDRELALWLYGRLKARGVRLTLDEHDPRSRAKWAYLMRLAEETKIKLAKEPTDLMPMTVKADSALSDDDGRPVTVTDRITRREFVALIQPLLDETIKGKGGGDAYTKGCELILVEAKVKPGQLREVLLVGGSTAGPWVGETIERAWGLRPRFLEPDRVVAAGAAIHARSLPIDVPGDQCRIELDTVAESPLETVAVGGRIHSPARPIPMAELSVSLSDHLGNGYSTSVRKDGSFVFEEVELAAQAVTRFDLSVSHGSHGRLAAHAFQIVHSADSVGVTPVLTVLPKPLFVKVVGGMTELAAEGVTLPAECEIHLARANEDDTIQIKLFQEDEPIGTIIIKGVPAAATIGSPVTLKVTVTRSNRIHGHALVHTRKGGVAVDATVDVSIPPIQVPEVEELRLEFEAVAADIGQRMEAEPDANTRMVMRAQTHRLEERIQKQFAGAADRQEVMVALRALKKLANPPEDDMEPPLAQFEALVLRLRELLASRPSDKPTQDHAPIIDRVTADARIAHSRKDRKRWARAFETLYEVLRRLERPQGGESRSDTPPTELQKLMASAEVDQVRQLLRAKENSLRAEQEFELYERRIARLREKIEKAQDTIDALDDALDPVTADHRIRMVLLQQLKPIMPQISHITDDLTIDGTLP